MSETYLRWARSESEAIKLQAAGWVANTMQPITHHHAYSLLLHWPFDTAPVLE